MIQKNNEFDHYKLLLSEKIDHFNLIDLKSTQINGLVRKVSVKKIDHLNFSHTDKNLSDYQSLWESNYYFIAILKMVIIAQKVFLKKRGKIVKPLGDLTGCPLEQTIRDALSIRARFNSSFNLYHDRESTVCINRARICNDCISSCIYQKLMQ